MYGNVPIGGMGNFPMSPSHRMLSPTMQNANRNYGFGTVKTEADREGLNQHLSPMLGSGNRLNSPGFLGFNPLNSGNELKYSPISPHYNASPSNNIYKATNKYSQQMSPSFKNSSSPFYSPSAFPGQA